MTLETTHPTEAALYLDQLDDLISEMKVGMKAIAENSVSALKASVARQEDICSAIAATGLGSSNHLRALSQCNHSLSEETAEFMIWKASETIRQLNLQYSALLAQSGKTLFMLSALCDNHTGRSIQHPGQWSKHQTWSCNV